MSMVVIISGFDKGAVLEKIIEEAPILSNRRGEIEAEVEEYDIRKQDYVMRKKPGKKVPIYAYYYNRGVPDPDLKYDRIKAPIKTTKNSTLCEIYSFWEGHPNVKDLIKRLTREKTIKPGEVIYQGPWMENHVSDDKKVIEATRKGEEYSFHHSAPTFQWHFNKICRRLEFEPRLNYETSNIEIRRQVKIEVEEKTFKSELIIKENIGIDLMHYDPTLSKVLDAIEKARKLDISGKKLHCYLSERAEEILQEEE